jgi:hypothetical protein
MPESYFSLSKDDQKEALETASSKTGLPPYLLEKDIWVVWALSALFQSNAASLLTFKGGTSLSKAYKAIHRFSEDIDLTCDIHQFIPEIGHGSPIPPNRSQADKWTEKVRKNLPGWIEGKIKPIIEQALKHAGIKAHLEISGKEKEKLIIHYPAAVKSVDYVSQTVQLEFGARSTGEPHEKRPIVCDIASQIPSVLFPTATPNVMLVERTFWEKATAIHVYCRQSDIPSDRFSRHWYDLFEISNTGYYSKAISDGELALNVAQHKEMFFREKDSSGIAINYSQAIEGKIELVPKGKSHDNLATDYKKMTESGLIQDPPSFKKITTRCGEIESKINHQSS